MSAEHSERPRAWPWALLVALAAIAVHLPFLAARPFFFGDDFGLLADAVNLSDGSESFFQLPAWGVWRFGQRAVSWAEYALFGLDPLPSHLVNVAVHAVASVLLFRLARALGLGPLIAAAAGMLFATWPAPSLTVRYPSVVAVAIATSFALAAMQAHLAARPWLTALLMLTGALFYEQALAVVPALVLINLARGRKLAHGIAVPAAGALLFVAANYWSLRHETKVFAYNPGGLGAIEQQALVAGAVAGLAPLPGVLAVAALLLLCGLGIAPRQSALGLGLAWVAVLPMVGRALAWPDWYRYFPAAGVSLAVAAALSRPRGAIALAFLLAAWNGLRQQPLATGYVQDSRNYEIVTRETAARGDVSAAVLLNVHSGLAWTAWQFGGGVRRFELWQAPYRRPRVWAGDDLDSLRAELLAAEPEATLRVRFPDDLPRAMWVTRAPERRRLFPWPEPSPVPSPQPVGPRAPAGPRERSR